MRPFAGKRRARLAGKEHVRADIARQRGAGTAAPVVSEDGFADDGTERPGLRSERAAAAAEMSGWRFSLPISLPRALVIATQDRSAATAQEAVERWLRTNCHGRWRLFRVPGAGSYICFTDRESAARAAAALGIPPTRQVFVTTE